MKIFPQYSRLPVSVKVLAPLLATFCGLWTAGIVGFGFLAENSLESNAHKEVNDFAAFVQLNLQQRQKALSLKARAISNNSDVIRAVTQGDGTLLQQILLPMQNTFEIDLVKIIDTQGKTLISLQQGQLQQATLKDRAVNLSAQTGLELSGVLLVSGQKTLSSLVELIPIKSSHQLLAGLVLGNAIDDNFLQQIQNSTSMHLVAFQGDQITASTLPIDRHQKWQFPLKNSTQWMKLGNEDYLAKTIEISSFDEAKITIAVLNQAQETEATEYHLWLLLGGFGLFGGLVVTGVTIGGFRTTQSLSRRIHNLTKVTQQLAAGDLSVEITIDAQDEVGVLAQGFNQMAEQLTARDRQLSQQMNQLELTLSDLHRSEQVLQKMNEELEYE